VQFQDCDDIATDRQAPLLWNGNSPGNDVHNGRFEIEKTLDEMLLILIP